jgi:hypothetical protein
VLLPVCVLLALAFLSTLGLEVDQAHVKKSSRWFGVILIAYGLGAHSWFDILLGGLLLLISHPRVNLPGISRRIDKSLGDGADHPARHVP